MVGSSQPDWISGVSNSESGDGGVGSLCAGISAGGWGGAGCDDRGAGAGIGAGFSWGLYFCDK